MGMVSFTKNPTSDDVQQAMKRIIVNTGTHPRYIVCDKGKQFDCDGFRQWCEDTGIKKPRYGAIGKHHSIALTERMIKSVKYLWTNLIIVSVVRAKFQEQLEIFRTWHNSERPHSSMAGRTPDEVYFDVKEPNILKPRFEPRPNCPAKCLGAKPHVPAIRGSPGDPIQIRVRFLDEEAGQHSRRLPVVEIVEDISAA